MSKLRSLTEEAEHIRVASELIQLDARLQVLESETALSRERLLRLYKELKGKSPPKGMLPFSTDWFLTWQPNTHASLFMNIRHFLAKNSKLDNIGLTIRAYRLYQEEIGILGLEPVLSITRAWRLVKFFDARMLKMATCRCCKGHYVADIYDLNHHYVCGMCNLPSRAGKTQRAAALRQEAEHSAGQLQYAQSHEEESALQD